MKEVSNDFWGKGAKGMTMISAEQLFGKTEDGTEPPRDIEAIPFHGEIPPCLWQSYSAFANTAGGIILLGAEKTEESFHIEGVDSPDRVMLDLWSALDDPGTVSAKILFKDHIFALEKDGKEFVVICVPRAERRFRPLYVSRDALTGTYKRSRGTNRLCSRNEIRTMLRQQEDIKRDGLLAWRWSLDELDDGTIDRYRKVFSSNMQEHPWNSLGREEYLVRMGAAGWGDDRKLHPSLAGVLFFGKRDALHREFPLYRVEYRELLPSGSGWVCRISSGDGDWSGNLFDFYCRVIDRITLPGMDRALKSLARDDEASALLFEKLSLGLSEAFTNALIHADYRAEGGVVVDRARNFTSISGPGTFPVDPSEAEAGGISSPVNPVIARMFSLIRAGNGNGNGMGISRMMAIWRETGLKKPQLMEDFDRNRSTILLSYDLEDCRSYLDISRRKLGEKNARMLTGSAVSCGPAEKTAGKKHRFKGASIASERIAPPFPRGMSGADRAAAADAYGIPLEEFQRDDQMTETDTRILELLVREPSATVKQLSEELLVSMSTVNRSLKHLKKRGILRRIGNTRGRWIVQEQQP